MRESPLSQNTVRFATTIDYSIDARWAARARLISPSANRKDELRSFFQMLRAAFQETALVLDSSSGRLHPELLAAAFIGLLPKRYRPVAILTGCMWQRDPGLKGTIQTLITRLADRTIDRYAVQSSEELQVFPRTWGISESKVRFCPYFSTITAYRLEMPDPSNEVYIFAGGNSLRDYDPLLAAARQMPDYRFIIATTRLKHRTDLPANVTAGAVSHVEFMGLLMGASAVVTPIRRGLTRAAGQQTYLNALWFGKPTVVTEALAVHDHIEHGKTGFIVDGSPESIVKTLRWIFDPANSSEVERIRKAGQAAAREQFTLENHVSHLLAILDEAISLRK